MASLTYADDAPPSPSPPGPSRFLHAILNPTGLAHARDSPLADHPPPAMAPTRSGTSASQRPGRLSNGYVDLTSMTDSPPRRRKRYSSSPGPSTKRTKPFHGRRPAESDRPEATAIQEVDLTDDQPPLQPIPHVQPQPQPQQKPQQETATTFNSFTCVICMDNPTDLSATACGHLFCHTCLMEALIAGENRTGPGEAKRSQCPVCRKLISRNKASDIVPLLLKKGLSTQPRKRIIVAAAGAAAAKV